jgi:hypothetical protein
VRHKELVRHKGLVRRKEVVRRRHRALVLGSRFIPTRRAKPWEPTTVLDTRSGRDDDVRQS